MFSFPFPVHFNAHACYADTVNQDELDFFNEVAPDDEVKDDHQEYLSNANKLREKHRELKDSYDNLERKTAQGRNRREFVDPKVINLWNVALQNNFTASELAALKVRCCSCFLTVVAYDQETN